MTSELKRNAAYHRAFGRRIVELRKRQQLTQEELAQRIGMSQQTVHAMEGGERRIPLSLVAALMRALNVDCEELLGVKSLRPARQGRMSPKLERHLERLKRLRRAEQRFVIRVTDLLGVKT